MIDPTFYADRWNAGTRVRWSHHPADNQLSLEAYPIL
jgi:hypothetical protein